MHYTSLAILILFIGCMGVESGKDPKSRQENLQVEKETPAENEVIVAAESDENKTETKPENSATFQITISAPEGGIRLDEANFPVIDNKNSTGVPQPRPGLPFLMSIQDLFMQFLRVFGVTTSATRKGKGMDFDRVEDNEVAAYREGIRTTIGAALGKSDCVKKATCGAGKYLKTIKGKELIIVILEKLTPATWMETVRMLKDSAFHNDSCEYKCLD